jgi:Uncharacterized protein conserved in bacteria (DUF2272)/N-acetylmuramoyl-L-alanine amidase
LARYPLAIWSPLPGIGAYADGPFKIIHHTTEGGSASGAIATYKETRNYPHFTVEEDAVYQHVDTNSAVTALEHRRGTIETNRSHAIQIELVGFAGRPKSRTALRTMAALCRWLEQQHDVPAVWPNGFPYPPVDGKRPNVVFNRDATNWQTKGGHYGHCHVPNNSHWDPGYTADEVAQVMSGVAVAAAPESEPAMPEMADADEAAAAAAPGLTNYVTRLIAITRGEYDAYHTITESNEPLRSRIDAYCRGIGIAPPDDIATFAWSATFVSWCIKTAGATRQEFTFSAAHAVFVRAAIANADQHIGVFRARPVDSYAPRPGDLIHRNRSGGTVTYSGARVHSDYPSHSAIVIEVGEDRIGRYAMTVGGNESDSIRMTRVDLDATGLVRQHAANPFICVVQDLKVEALGQDAPLPAAAAATPSQRLAMAKIIIGYEAQTDSQGRLMVHELPPADGGGRYEVAGINERYNKTVCDELVALIRSGQQDEAMQRAAAYIADNTDIAANWTSNTAVEFYLRDCVFNRGARGAAWILQKAVGVDTDEAVGSHTLAAVARAEASPLNLLDDLRQSREAYERLRRDESSPFWRGLVNRWNNALAAAKTFLPQQQATPPAGPQPEPASPPVTPSPGDPVPPDGQGFVPPTLGGAGGAQPPTWAAAPGLSRVAPDYGGIGDDGQTTNGSAQAPPEAAYAAAAPPRPSPIGPNLLQLHKDLESRVFARRTASAFAAQAAGPPGAQDMIVGVGIGAAHRDFESVGPAGPGAPVLNVYVAEAMSMDAVKRVLVDQYRLTDLAPDRTPVNVHHTGTIYALAPMQSVRPSPCGISIGHYKITAGTQGALARGLSSERRKRLLVLSNNHILANCNDCAAGDAIHQPGRADLLPNATLTAANQIGVLEQWVPIDFAGAPNYVDCATAWCWPDRVRKDFIRPASGLWSYFNVGAQPVAAAQDMQVGKTGRTTQLTTGGVVDVNASISVSYGDGKVANFRDQVTITGAEGRPFSDGGDSGSLIWTWDGIRAPVGLLFAGGRDYTFANKIGHVLQALEVELFT